MFLYAYIFFIKNTNPIYKKVLYVVFSISDTKKLPAFSNLILHFLYIQLSADRLSCLISLHNFLFCHFYTPSKYIPNHCGEHKDGRAIIFHKNFHCLVTSPTSTG